MWFVFLPFSCLTPWALNAKLVTLTAALTSQNVGLCLRLAELAGIQMCVEEMMICGVLLQPLRWNTGGKFGVSSGTKKQSTKLTHHVALKTRCSKMMKNIFRIRASVALKFSLLLAGLAADVCCHTLFALTLRPPLHHLWSSVCIRNVTELSKIKRLDWVKKKRALGIFQTFYKPIDSSVNLKHNHQDHWYGKELMA